MRGVDQNILLSEGEIPADLQLTKNPIGKFDRAAHVAGPATESTPPDQDGTQDQQHHDRGRVDGSFGQGRYTHHGRLSPEFDPEDMP